MREDGKQQGGFQNCERAGWAECGVGCGRVVGVVWAWFWIGAGDERTAGYVAAEIVVIGLVAHLDGGIRTML